MVALDAQPLAREALPPATTARPDAARRDLGLYVHIPFCVKKCPYCDFNSGPATETTRAVQLRALEQEIRRNPWVGSRGRTLFLGGGTPSELTASELTAVVAALDDAFRIDADAERTIECNPGTLEVETLAAMRALGFNRVSLGVQSFHDGQLRTLGRIHDAEEARRGYAMVRAAGFDNVNLDLIFGLPEQTLAEWEADLRQAIDLAPEHLSLYQLTIEKATEFGRRQAAGERLEADEDLAAEMYECALDLTAAAGYEQYEISNFAQRGRECAHNLIYWRNEEYLGLGVSAASYVGGRRWSNTGNWASYAAHAPGGIVPHATDERLAPPEALAEEIMLRLRIRDGVSLSALSARYDIDVRAAYAEPLAFLAAEGLLRQTEEIVHLTRRGKLLANAVCAEFLGRQHS